MNILETITNTDVSEEPTRQAETQTEENGKPEEKLFTQEEVNRIVSERLERDRARAKAKTEPTAEQMRAKELDERENRLICKEYALDNKLPCELLDVLDTSDPEAFKTKAEKVMSIAKGCTNKPVMPLASTEWKHTSDPMDEAFSPSARHTPKYRG